MAEIAVPALISGVAAIGSSAIQANAQKEAAKQLQEMAPPTLSYDEALEQAQGVLNPLYDEQLEKNLQAVDRGNLSRGFYGQMPGDALKLCKGWSNCFISTTNARSITTAGVATTAVSRTVCFVKRADGTQLHRNGHGFSNKYSKFAQSV